MKIRSVIFGIALALTIVPGIVACNGPTEAAQATGTVNLPLTAVSSTGTTYRLQNAQFSVSGGNLLGPLLLSSVADPTVTTLTADLPSGAYYIAIANTWQMVRVEADGTTTPVTATLTSPESQSFNVEAQAVAAVSYEFNVDGTVVQTGPGKVQVSIGVTESDFAGYYKNDVIAGYAWSAASGPGTTVSPTSFSSVLTNGPFCVKGTVAPAADYSGVVLVGVNLNQSSNGPTAAIGTYSPVDYNLVFDVTNNTANPLRIQLQGADASSRWCVNIAGSGSIPLSTFNTTCWSPANGVPYRGEALTSVEVLEPGNNQTSLAADFCLNSVVFR